jgi:pimeloyl-ACP methyl ester carboxylesterase
MADANYSEDLKSASTREDMAESAGNKYVADIAEIRKELDEGDTTSFGASLGTMLKVQVSMTEAETEFMTTSSIPKKVSSTILQAGQEVKKTAGG